MLLQKLEETLEPIFYQYKQARRPEEAFGDFCSRVGFEALRTYSANYVGQAAQEKLPQVRLAQSSLDSVQAVAAKQVGLVSSSILPSKGLGLRFIMQIG